MIVQVHIDPSLPIIPEIEYVLSMFAHNKRINIQHSVTGISIGTSDASVIKISKKFIERYAQQKFSHSENLGDSGFIELEDNSPDYLSTAFYMLACLQEYNSPANYDSSGRFKYSASYQAKFSNADQNIVQLCFDRLAEKLGLAPARQRSRFFLSHDMDTVYGALFQDGFHAVKHGRMDVLLKLIFRAAIQKPDWLNIDQIMKLEREHDCVSTFFWIVKKGKAEGLQNADYTFQSPAIQNLLTSVKKNGFENGIHKSVSGDSFQSEIQEFAHAPIANRYHYLKFNLPAGFDAVEASGLKLDASLGFAESIGFRNSYGLPYNPFNLKTRQPYSFIEVPLHVMDTTLFKYNKSGLAEANERIFNFLENNKNNSVLSVLWHNNFFSNYKYKGYLELYKSILVYLVENSLKTITQSEILQQFSIRRH